MFSYFLQHDFKLFGTLFIISLWFPINTPVTGQPELLTSLAGVVHEHDLHQQVSGGAVDDAVDGAQQGAPGLVVKDNHNAGAGHVVGIHLCFTADEAEQGWNPISKEQKKPWRSLDGTWKQRWRWLKNKI